MEIQPLGDSALIVRVVADFARDPDGSLTAVLDVLEALEAAAIPGVIELAPAYATVAVFYDPVRISMNADSTDPFESLRKKIVAIISAGSSKKKQRSEASAIEVPVCYDRAFALDLDKVEQQTGLSGTEIIRRHASAAYRVNCIGFSPGFPYLSGLPAELATPRRATPRTDVPAGSLAIGGAQTGIYPKNSPGGWNVIGRTPLVLFDVRRDPPARLRAGDRVRFRQITREEFDEMSR
ncbi:MAG TPA: 5-oxoprolinase subunit PxpB [Chthoniobacterales bacterium]|jgi:inhibitor of KinA